MRFYTQYMGFSNDFLPKKILKEKILNLFLKSKITGKLYKMLYVNQTISELAGEMTWCHASVTTCVWIFRTQLGTQCICSSNAPTERHEAETGESLPAPGPASLKCAALNI